MAYALGSSLLLLLLGLVTRRLLVDNFGPQITTASQVVSQLFNFFSIAEFGVGSVISYRLYEQIAAKNEEKISKYMSMYKWAYRVVGLVIAGLALIGAAALRWIMPDVPAATAYTVYGLNVISTLCSYFLITRRLMYTCTQQGYRCTQIDFCCNVLTSLAKIAVSLWFPNYVLYFSVTIFFNVTANLLIARRFRKDFPYVHDVKVTVNDFKDLGIFHDLRYFLVHRLSNTIYGSSDTIVTSRLGGSTQTTFLGNYNTISTSATDLGNKVMDSFAAAIGSIVYDKSAAANDHDKQVFWGMDLFSYLFASFVATAYFCLFQPFMASWMGEKWLLPLGFVLVFCLNEYVGWNHRMLGSYRAVLGHFEDDQWFMVASATVNLALSFILFPLFDITGALMVLERNNNLDEIIRTGTPMHADVIPEMLGTIFYEGTPLHDGAVVIRDGVIVAAGCVLPLSNNLEMGKDMGTRHRAGLGMSENSDAIVVIVSEETGIISMAKNGVLIRRLDRQNLFNLLQEEIVPPAEDEETNISPLQKLLRKGGALNHAKPE